MTDPHAVGGTGLLDTARGRRLLFAALYFTEGAPIGFIWWGLPTLLRSAGMPAGEVARLVAWVAWPWAVKFLWAPLVDVVRGPRFGLRGWIVSSQCAMAVSLLPLLWLDPAAHGGLLLGALLAHALFASTQDAAIDTLAVHRVPPHERGAVNGWMQVGLLAARGLFGGGAVLLAVRVGEPAVVALLVAVILGSALLVAMGIRPGGLRPARDADRSRFGPALRSMFRQRVLWGGLLFATLAGAGFEGLASLAGPLLLDHGASEDAVGVFFLVPVVVLMAVGALGGGRLSDRFGRRRVTALTEALAATAVLAVGTTAWLTPPGEGWVPLLALLGLLYLAAGMATASLYGLLMDRVDPAVAATQFCAFMGAINLCYVWATASLGLMVDHAGYGPGLVALGLVSLASLPLLLLLGPRAPAGNRSTGGDGGLSL